MDKEDIVPHVFQMPAFQNPRGNEDAILTWDDVDTVLALLDRIAPGWSAELNQTCPTDSTIVVMPEGANDLIGPSFVLHWHEGRIRLDQFHWDEYRKLGAFASLEDALATMRERLVPLVTATRGGSASRH